MPTTTPEAAPIALGTTTFDAARLELRSADGRLIPLRPQSLRVLEQLLAHAGRVVGREELFT